MLLEIKKNKDGGVYTNSYMYTCIHEDTYSLYVAN